MKLSLVNQERGLALATSPNTKLYVRLALKPAFVAPVLALAAFLAGCAGDKSSKNPCAENDRFGFEGVASDETCRALLDAEDAEAVTVGGPNAIVMVMPTNGGVIAVASSSVSFTWTSAIDADGDLGFALPARMRAVPVPAPVHPARLFWNAIQPISTAWAHQPPVTGAVHSIRAPTAARRSLA